MQKIKCVIGSIISLSLASVALILFVSAKTVKIAPEKGKVLATSPSVEYSPEQVREYVATQAQKAGVNVQEALWVIDHESQDGKRMYGDDNQSLGYFQISRVYHPEVSVACAMDLTCSTRFFLSSVLKGKIGEWTTWKYRCKWYQDAPDCEMY
jgi:nitric oxide reductase large subunit